MTISFGKITPYKIFVDGVEKKAYDRNSKNEINGIARIFASAMSDPKKCNTPELKSAREIFSEHVSDYFIPENDEINSSSQVKNLSLKSNERYLISTKKDIDRFEDLRKNTMGLDIGYHGMSRKDALKDLEEKNCKLIHSKSIDKTSETLNIYVKKNYNGKTNTDKYKITGINFQA